MLSARWRIVLDQPSPSARPGIGYAFQLWCTPATATRFAALWVYIRPHFRKCGAVVPLKLHLVPRTATRPPGFQNRPYAKCPSLESGRTAIGASRSLRALRTVVCTSLWGAWPCFHSGAARCVFYSVARGQTTCVCPVRPKSTLSPRSDRKRRHHLPQ